MREVDDAFIIRQQMASFMASEDEGMLSPSGGECDDEERRVFLGNLLASRIVVFSQDMVELAFAAGAAMEGATITASDLESPGLSSRLPSLWFFPDRPFRNMVDQRRPVNTIKALLLAPVAREQHVESPSGFQIVVMAPGQDGSTAKDVQNNVSSGGLEIGDRVPGRLTDGSLEMRTLVAGGFALMKQRLVADLEIAPSRPIRRRIAREGGDDRETARVIVLRQIEGRGGEVGGVREHHHQWLVGWPFGHWRQQWYPSIGEHRPVLIAPYIKGPTGAPLLKPRETAIAVVR